nr:MULTISPECIES: HEAT repeat domain-containing protein [unclassified Streptomyces]
MDNRHELQADPRRAFADFLHAQAAEAGMGADKIAKAFEAAARQQQEQLKVRREAGQTVEPPAHPISEMAASKSHIDRLFKGQAHPKPPLPFTLQFLKITNLTAGLSAEEHRSRCERARSLLQAIRDTPVPLLPVRLLATDNGTEEQREDAVAVLRLEVDLERARHTETRLRYALRDHDVLLSTLLQIVSMLREIIAGNDIRELRARRIPIELARVRDETRQALDHKATAQQEADRATARIRILEDLWNRARAEAQRLASHPDAADSPLSHLDPQQAPQPLLASELLTRPALDDIGAALAKAHEVSLREEKAVQELQSAITPQDGPLEPDEELSVLITATRLSDPAARRTALTALVNSWSHDPVAKEAVLRLADDLNEGVRIAAVEALAEGWPGDPDVRRLCCATSMIWTKRCDGRRSRPWPKAGQVIMLAGRLSSVSPRIITRTPVGRLSRPSRKAGRAKRQPWSVYWISPATGMRTCERRLSLPSRKAGQVTPPPDELCWTAPTFGTGTLDARQSMPWPKAGPTMAPSEL